MSAPMLTPGSGGGSKPKPVPYDPLSSIQAPKPKPEPQKPIVPIVVYTAFDADTAEKLKNRLEETIHPVDQPKQTETYDPPPPRKATEKSSQPSLPDVEEPELTVADLEFDWSSEAPFPSLDAGEMSDYFSAQEDNLVRDVSISLQHEKFILDYLEDPLEYLKHFATYTWDEESDAAAEKFIQWYVERFRSELEKQREYTWSLDALSDIEYWIREVANDKNESVIVVDLETGETLFVRYGDRDSVTMHTLHQKLAEGRNIALIHNHPNNSGASPADLSAAAWLDAEYMMIVNRDGAVHRHQKIDGEIVELEPLHNPDIVAPIDPLETVVDSIAYWIQTLRESGNPAEMVMEQGKPLWWQEGNIIVPYHTDETIEEVAARMIGPPPSEAVSREQYEKLHIAHQKQLAEFTAYLRELNPSDTSLGVINIPAPGWSTFNEHSPRGARLRVRHATRATLLYPIDDISDQRIQVMRRWNSLSPVEQKIEMALTGSNANIDRYVKFNNADHDFDYTLSWLQTHEDTISDAANDFKVSSISLNTILGSELMYDYGWDDSQQDSSMRSGFRDAALRFGELVSWDKLAESWDGAGIANAHYPALVDAYFHIDAQLEPGEVHPWQLDPNAPDLESAPQLTASDERKSEYVTRWADFYENRTFDQLSQREQEVALFWIRQEKLVDVPWNLRQDIAYYASSVEGSVRTAAMIGRMYSDQLTALDSTSNVWNNPRDIARVWGRYRSADHYFDYLGNAQLAYPIADFFSAR